MRIAKGRQNAGAGASRFSSNRKGEEAGFWIIFGAIAGT